MNQRIKLFLPLVFKLRNIKKLSNKLQICAF